MPEEPTSETVRPASVVVARCATEEGAPALLESVLGRAGFWDLLAAVHTASGVDPADFRVVVKPDLAAFDRGSPLATDPSLVEHFIDLLHDRGFTHVEVAYGADPHAPFLANRDALALADLLGYRFVTPRGRSYDVVDLATDLVPAGFPEGSALQGIPLSRAWTGAHFRVGFAKNKTHEEFAYALCLYNLWTVLPDQSPHRARIDPADACTDLLQYTPTHFNVIDAVVSNHGSFGASVPRPLPTRTLIAAANPLLADWAAAAKMNIDPYRSSVNARALKSVGLPEPYVVDGDLSPYEGWTNVHPLVSDSVGRLRRSVTLGGMLSAVIPRVNRETFPFLDPRADSLNALLSPLYAHVDDNPAAFALVTAMHYQLAAADEYATAWTTLLDKDRLYRKELPLDLDLSKYTPSDYESVVDYMEPLAELVHSAPVDAHGLRYRYVDGSILFEYTRVLVAPYESVVKRVPIERAVQFMNDYIGGCAVPVARDEDGRVTRQAERTMFLPQPGFMVFYAGKPIDVAKLEVVTYGTHERSIYWRTVKSSNDSADFDDGVVTFAAAGEDSTRITIVARQRFALPPAWQAVRLDLNPEFKTAVELWAYRNYFDQTMNNLEACYEGREFRIGRPWGAPDKDPFAPFDEAVRRLGIGRKDARVARIVSVAASAVRRLPVPTATDEQGFEHFRAEDVRIPTTLSQGTTEARKVVSSLWDAARAFAAELSEAVRKDLGK